ncbi:uncharacterized protein LOC110035665 [Phalaenopsis equestris]|uniref:uncharacterized protein LOC110035665 n=1 Tax=Phalaenopsis equestris TaxID=78828 RepID=UPI0009E21A65|nr:uncharacterized protein LOC110035665 [Phalaenopsis equestris]
MMKLELQSLVSDPTLSDSRTTTTTAPTTAYHALILLYTTNRNPNPNPMPISNSHPKAMAADGPSERDQATPMTVAVVSKSNPGSTWADLETSHLIDVYEEKWNSSKRGPLRAKQWEDVAVEVAHRCGLNRPSKSGTQCRHKIEKLRKRFRSDRLRSLTLRPHAPPTSTWPFFPLMESLECPPPASLSGSTSHSDDADNSRNIHRRLLSNGEGLRFTIPKAVRSKIVNPSSGGGKLKTEFFDIGVKPAKEQMRRRLERKRKEEMEQGTLGGMVAALRMVGDGFMRMERVKMDVVRETEKMRMEMELKRTQMILDSQQRIVDAFVEGFIGGVKRKKAKISPDS